jgi:hypothetical protein
LSLLFLSVATIKSNSHLNFFFSNPYQKAYQKQQSQIQEKLKDCVEKQSMKSLERLSHLFDPNSDDNGPAVMETSLGIANADATTKASQLKGENKAPIKRTGRRKHSLKNKKATAKKTTEKKRPKYFVQF